MTEQKNGSDRGADAEKAAVASFDQLGISEEVLRAVGEVGYEAPSSIQARAIPPLLEGRDLLGQAQTGTGKTAAFALPILSNLQGLDQRAPQVLVLTPTRELAIQVAEAMQTYARHVRGFHVVPVYGGQSIEIQLHQLRRRVHVVVGTPGRIQDHLRRGSLDLRQLRTVVLDEADEMLRMGFLEEVELILEATPKEKQVALFSATMPDAIRKVARKYLRDPVEIKIEARTATVETVHQRYWRVEGVHKLDALTRILEVENFEAMLIFVRTKVATVELSEKLEARGFRCGPLNGDMNQALRERTIERLRQGRLEIVVATDVAARGLDVDRISHVVNYDIPYDVEAYVHRIGRTGRAGREGQAILFVSPRERRLLFAIERATRQRIEKMYLPSREAIAESRVQRFKERVAQTLEDQDLGFFIGLVDEFSEESGRPMNQVAAALAFLHQKDRPLVVPQGSKSPRPQRPREERDRPSPTRPPGPPKAERAKPEKPPAQGMVRYRIEVGHDHGVQPKNIVGAIANEAMLDGHLIGHIRLFDRFSTVDLPEGMPRETYRHLQSVRVCGQELRLRRQKEEPQFPRGARKAGPPKFKPPKFKKKRGKKKR